MARRASTTDGAGDRGQVGTGGGGSGSWHREGLGVIRAIEDLAGLSEVRAPRYGMPDSNVFKSIHAALGALTVAPGLFPTRTTSWAHYVHVPGNFGELEGGLSGLVKRGLRDWPTRRRPPEVWFIGFVHDVPIHGAPCRDSVTIHVSRILSSVGRRIEAQRQPVRWYQPFTVPTKRLVRFVYSGPYLALVSCSLSPADRIRDARLTPETVLLDAIASTRLPVPVDSGLERSFALWLADRNEPFIKPLINDPDGLRVDFILPALRVIVELDGRKDDATYLKRKRGSHRRVTESDRYAHYELIAYEPKRDDDFSELGRQLDEFAASRGRTPRTWTQAGSSETRSDLGASRRAASGNAQRSSSG